VTGWRVFRSGFSDWRTRPDSATAKRRHELKLLITKAFADSDGTYGYRRVAAQLGRWGVHAGPELVRGLMRELVLVPCQPRPWRPATTQQGAAGPIPDLVNRDFTAAAPGEKRSLPLATATSGVFLNGDLFHGRVPDGAVYVGRAAPGLRASPYANPFRLRDHGPAEAVRLYRDYLAKRQDLAESARRDLAGRDLACWCKPGAPCHADALLVIANAHEEARDSR
jgi:hypothetical protein